MCVKDFEDYCRRCGRMLTKSHEIDYCEECERVRATI